MNNTEKIGLKKIILFGSGDLFGGGSQVIVSFFYLIFLTDVVGISIGTAGLVVGAARFWDAISDPLMGIITDNTKSKWGRRRPYFFLGFFAILAAYILLWMPTGIASESGKVAFAIVSYLFYSTVITMVLVPYSAMSAEITMDYEERNKVNGVRLFFSQLASLIGAVLPLTIVGFFFNPETGIGDEALGFGVMGLVFAIFFAVPYLLIALFIKENTDIERKRSKFSLKVFLSPFRVRAFRLLLGLYVMAFVAMDVISAIIAYYMRYYFGKPGDTEIVLGILLLSVIIMLPLVVIGANKIGKGWTFTIGATVAMLGVLLFAFLPQDANVILIYVAATVAGLGLAPVMTVPWLMFPDTTDVGELKFGERNEGSFSGLMTFVRKLANTIAFLFITRLLAGAGYLEPLKEKVEGRTVTTYFTQPDSVIQAFKIIIAVAPIVLLVLAIFLAIRYPLTKHKHDRLRAHLEAKREGLESPLLPEEIQEIEASLL